MHNAITWTVRDVVQGTSEWSAAEIEEAWAVADRLGLVGVMPSCEGSACVQHVAASYSRDPSTGWRCHSTGAGGARQY